jgi:RNA polymerase sigma-70 factor, ECF subfamily
MSYIDAPSDSALIEAVLRGDQRIARALYDRLEPTVDRTLYRIFGRREVDHDDLVQTTFEQIVLTLSKRKFAAACSLKTWASTLATHVGLNALRARRRERNVLDRSESVEEHAGSAQSAAPEGDRAAQTRLELARLRDTLASMDPNKAETVFLHDVLGHDLAEIAVLTEVTVAAAQSRLVRGRKELVSRLSGGRGP